MGEDKGGLAEILKQLQFPVAVFACLQAGSIFYLAIYFDHITEKYKIPDEVSNWFNFMLNGSALFGILPGLLLKWLDPKKTVLIGGALIVLGQTMTALMVSSEHAALAKAPAWMLGTISVLAGQGSCLVLFSSMQALMNLQTIQASHVISTCLICYYLGADSFIESLKEGLFAETTFTDFTMSLAIAAFVLTVLNGVVVTDVEDAEGFFGKAASLTKGIIYKKTNYGHVFILIAYTTVLLFSYFQGDLKGDTASIVLTSLVLANLLVPVALIFMLSPERIKHLVGEPSDIEKRLANKGADLTVSEAAQRMDFWYFSICAMVVIGASRMYDENARLLGLHNEEKEDMIEQTFNVYEVIGALLCGCILIFFRAYVRPTAVVVMAVLIAGLGSLAMVWPDSVTIDDPLRIGVATASFAEGALYVALASHCHEDYGTENFGILYGTMFTFGAVGMFGLNEMLIPGIVEEYTKDSQVHYFKAYGEWNVFLFGCIAGAYAVCFIISLIAHINVTQLERADSQKLVMVKF